MSPSELLGWLAPSLFLSLRLAPALAFAPPFTLAPTPVWFRVLLALGIAVMVSAAHPAERASVNWGDIGYCLGAGLRELMIGAAFALALQLAFAALYMAGRTVDVQAGYGLALLADPTTQNQTPLVGTLFAYAAAVCFFAMDGPAELLRIFAASVKIVPPDALAGPTSLLPLAAFMSTIFGLAFGVAGGVILCLFLADLAIAMMSRTMPQMNVLVLGLQAKTVIALIMLPAVLGGSGALFVRMMRLTLETIPRLI